MSYRYPHLQTDAVVYLFELSNRITGVHMVKYNEPPYGQRHIYKAVFGDESPEDVARELMRERGYSGCYLRECL